MKVAVDISPLKTGHRYRGIGVYTKNLVGALQSIKAPDFSVQLIESGKILKDCDLAHYPYFDFFFLTLPLIKKKKTVVTVHDCIPLVFPEHYPPGPKGKVKFFIQKLSLKNVSAVITDSDNSKKDIEKFLGVPEEKINTVYLAADPAFKKLLAGNWQEKNRQKYRLPEKFVLYVGDVNFNKNLPNLIEAFARIEDKQVYLVLVGKAFEKKELEEVRNLLSLISQKKISERVKILGFIPDEDLVSIYNLSNVYCQPSFYEGFGLQVLEAMACGCPVITSGVSSLPEIAGDAAFFVDPYSYENISEAIQKVIDDEKLRQKMIELGFSQAKKFSWKKTAEETINIYEKILEE